MFASKRQTAADYYVEMASPADFIQWHCVFTLYNGAVGTRSKLQECAAYVMPHRLYGKKRMIEN